MENTNLSPDPRFVLDSLNDGTYVVDRDRTIQYWGKSAERITGWQSSDVLGKRCHDDVLCHMDKDGRQLCGEEYCPLHRAMVTGQGSVTPIIVFAQGKNGHRIPMEVSVAPVKNASGQVVGGVETFRDLSSQFHDIERAQRIQTLSLQDELPENECIRFSVNYTPHDVIGGDYYAVTQLDEDCYGFLLADVTGHGVPAALYTMYLNSLWHDNHHLVLDPRVFAEVVNKKLCNLIKESSPFAASMCGVFDLKRGKLLLSSAGNPPPLLIRSDGECEYPDCGGLPLGAMEDATYEETVLDLRRGDCILIFTDGAIEIADPQGKHLGFEGLVTILKSLGYPQSAVGFKEIEEELLRYSDRIRLDDDVTFLEARLV